MADHTNSIPMTCLCRSYAELVGAPAPRKAAAALPWMTQTLRARAGGDCDRALIVHSDAIPMYVYQKYTELFAPVFPYVSLALPLCSTVESVTPVAHATMYTGLTPEQHGIRTYERPKLECETLYDSLLAAGKKPIIVAALDSSFLHIFAGRNMPYIEVADAGEGCERTLELLKKDEYDFISLHIFDYDNAAHRYGPESPQALEAAHGEAVIFERLARVILAQNAGHTTLLGYAPDHGQHLTQDGHGAHGSTMIEDMNVMQFYGILKDQKVL